MQKDLFRPDENLEENCDVLEIRTKKVWNEQNKRFDELILYVHTRPKNWKGPEKSNKLPWEE